MRNYLLATDGSECSLKAAKFLIDMVREQPDAQITIFHVNYTIPVYTEGILPLPVENLREFTAEDKHKMVLDTTELFDQADIKYQVKIRDGFPASEIIQETKEGAYDLLVVGSHGYGAMDRILLGSVSERVAEEAVCPVLVVK